MAEIKKWFQKKKMDLKFKTSGPGQKVSGGGSSRPSSQRESLPDDSRQRAAQAALDRFQHKPSGGEGRSKQAIRKQAEKEIEALTTGIANVHVIDEKEFAQAPVLSVKGVFYTCPLLGDDVKLPRDALEQQLEDFLAQQYAQEPLMSAAAMIASLNRPVEKRAQCIETIQKYLANILEHPGEEKYTRIRRANKVFAQKVSCCKGAIEFLQAVGFEPQDLQSDEGFADQYLVMSKVDEGVLLEAVEYLATTDAIPIVLDRGTTVLKPSQQGAQQVKLPPDFYEKTSEEVKKEQAEKSMEVDKMLALRTKEMREREEIKRLYRYRFSLVRIRFPDDYILQGTFRTTESLCDIEDFVRPCLFNPDLPFALSDTRGNDVSHQHQNEEGLEPTLAELGLAPAAILVFKWDPDIIAAGVNQYLRDDLIGNAEVL